MVVLHVFTPPSIQTNFVLCTQQHLHSKASPATIVRTNVTDVFAPLTSSVQAECQLVQEAQDTHSVRT